MKTSENDSGSASKEQAGDATSELQKMAEEVIKFIEDKAKNIDKATLAKYVAVAILVIYGLRKSNLLGSLAISLITGIVTKYLADMVENKGQAASSSSTT